MGKGSEIEILKALINLHNLVMDYGIPEEVPSPGKHSVPVALRGLSYEKICIEYTRLENELLSTKEEFTRMESRFTILKRDYEDVNRELYLFKEELKRTKEELDRVSENYVRAERELLAKAKSPSSGNSGELKDESLNKETSELYRKIRKASSDLRDLINLLI